ncbi:hypothetical protein BW730_11955 [Tessaracoccus aquimaris]|uniref:HTH lacI-type domain-containing protein n=1 Tax=Tessaracoccus aquimaris TaxID=1332264 RepID=A0A1Q2CPP0_9ACTN|nr:LacI family DNA-binding transcriptional regulator [Tessaracoccus aquimaris]AQP48097.1 hypothetical protein BW730_11955 [Tessaracoccus aquimaris]
MSSTRRPTMTDVAKMAGVSLKTVSRVVNGVATVDEEMAASVNTAIAALGYRHNLLAASLKAGSGASLVGLITTDLSDPFYGSVANAVDEVARARGFGVLMTGSAEDASLERSIALDLCARQVRGLIVVPASDSGEYLQEEVARGLRVVFADRPAAGIDADTVLVDNRGLGRRMANLAVSRGHRRVGILLGSESIYTHRERYLGITEALSDAGVAIDPDLVVRDVSEPHGAEGGSRRVLSLPDPPTALLCTNNRLMLGAVTALCHTRQTADIIAFDDPEYSEVLPMPVTLIAQNPVELGRVAAERLFARLEGDESVARTFVLPTQLVVRGGLWRPGA